MNNIYVLRTEGPEYRVILNQPVNVAHSDGALDEHLAVDLFGNSAVFTNDFDLDGMIDLMKIVEPEAQTIYIDHSDTIFPEES